GLLDPRLIHIDMAGGASAGAAAFGGDLGNVVAARGLHHCRAGLALDGARLAVRIDEGDIDLRRGAAAGLSAVTGGWIIQAGLDHDACLFPRLTCAARSSTANRPAQTENLRGGGEFACPSGVS